MYTYIYEVVVVIFTFTYTDLCFKIVPHIGYIIACHVNVIHS